MSTQQFTFTFASLEQITEFAQAWIRSNPKDQQLEIKSEAEQKHPIEMGCGLSTRTMNVLRAENLKYMEEVMKLGALGLRRSPNVGAKTISEIEDWARANNMWWAK